MKATFALSTHFSNPRFGTFAKSKSLIPATLDTLTHLCLQLTLQLHCGKRRPVEPAYSPVLIPTRDLLHLPTVHSRL